MGKTHDDDEVEIDLRELFYALKKHILIILGSITGRSSDCRCGYKDLYHTSLQCNFYNAGF